MKNKKVITAIILMTVIIIGVSGIVVNAQYQKKQEAIRIAESEAEESRALEEAQEAKLLELQEIEDRVYTLYLDETHDFLVDEITQEMIDEVNILIEAQDGKEIYDYAGMLNSSIMELGIIQNMFNLQSDVSALTLEHVLNDEGAAKLAEIQATLETKTGFEDKTAFTEQQSAIVNEIINQLTEITDLEARIKTYFTDEECTAVVDTVTREELNELITLKDTVTVESKRWELESTLMTIANYLDAKDAEAQASASSNTSNSNSNSSSGSSSSSSTGSSSSDSGSSSQSSSASTGESNGSSSVGSTSDSSSSSSDSSSSSESTDTPIGSYTGEITGGGVVDDGGSTSRTWESFTW